MVIPALIRRATWAGLTQSQLSLPTHWVCLGVGLDPLCPRLGLKEAILVLG